MDRRSVNMAKYQRSAEWVWRPRDLDTARTGSAAKFREEANRFVYFRKSFNLTAAEIGAASLDVSADARYQLFVNGQLVGRGPARCSPDWQYYDTYDIGPYLRPGRNVVAALVRSYGRDFAWYELPRWQPAEYFGCGGWFAQGAVQTADGGTVRLDTDASWRCLPSQAWDREAPGGWVGYVEVYDARLAPQGWQAVGFDDAGWAPAQVLRAPGWWGGNDIVPFPVMVPRDIPFLPETLNLPASLLKMGEVVNVPGVLTCAPDKLDAAITAETIGEFDACRASGLESLLTAEGGAVVETTAERSVALSFDFGKTETGRVRFVVDGPAGAVIDFRYSERLWPDGRPDKRPWGYDGEVYPQTHRVTLAGGPLAWEMFDYAGFRYLQLTIRNSPTPLTIRQVGVNFSTYPVGDRGRFACSDPLLDDIYRISGYTLQCCMHDSYEDCPSREQRQWTNDQYIHLLANYGLFGDPRLARKLLVQVGQSQRADGQVMMCAPGDFSATNHMNMPEFTLHWIMSIGQYVRYTGDAALIHELYPTVVKGLGWFERHLDDDDLLDEVPGVLWVDWAEMDKVGQHTELNARYVGCLRIAAGFAERLGYAQDAALFDGMADRVAAAINAHLWDEARGVYVDARRAGGQGREGVPGRRVSQASNLAAMYFDVAPAERWDRILSYILDERRLRLTNALGVYGKVPFDDECEVVLAHAFYQHFLHAVLARVGRAAEIAPNMRRLWGPQAKAGVSTWWEAWEVEPAHSLCHAFMCAPGHDLPAYVLGVLPLEDGFTRFRIAPEPAGLAWAKGVFPAVCGDIPVTWECADGRLTLSAQVPAGTQAEIVVPRLGGRAPTTVTLDGAPASGNLTVGPGEHELVAEY
jgi:alpha-L-rhamnosidase